MQPSLRSVATNYPIFLILTLAVRKLDVTARRKLCNFLITTVIVNASRNGRLPFQGTPRHFALGQKRTHTHKIDEVVPDRTEAHLKAKQQ